MLPLLLSVLLAASPASPSITVDLDGDGSAETVTAIAHGSKIEVEVRSAAGKRVARVRIPSPKEPVIALSAGSLGGSGAILEVAAATSEQQCRTFWRLRGQELSNLPIARDKGRLPDCSAPQGWTDRWERPSEDAPAAYVRERTRSTANGVHHRTEVYRFTGFDLRFDPSASTAEIGGVAIPDWADLSLYPRPLIEALFSCFNLSPFRRSAQLSFVTDRDEGFFFVIVRQADSVERLPILTCAPGKGKGAWDLTAGSPTNPIRLNVQLDKADHSPLEVMVDGLSLEFGRIYVPVSHLTAQGLEIFPNAEGELVMRSLAGSWDNVHGERIEVAAISMNPAVLEFGKEKAGVSIERAPRGADVVLLPRDGSAPKTALVLRGPNVMGRQSVSCSAGAAFGPATCRVEGPVEVFRRVGAEVNAR